MSNYISDFSKTRWMVSNPARVTRTGMDGKPFRCPFCEGSESDTPPEVFRIGEFENLNDSEIKSLAVILQSMILKLKKIHDKNPHYSKKPFGYNFYILIPSVIPAEAGIQNTSNAWYLRIIPRFMERAGFELSTGIMVNSVEAKRA